MRKKRAGNARSRASIARRSRARSRARKTPGSGRTLHGDERGAERRERQQRLASRHTRGRHRARAREKSSSRVSRLRAPSGCSFSRDPRRAIDRRVSFPSKRSSRSGFAPDGAGDQLVRVKLWRRADARRSDVSSIKRAKIAIVSFSRLPGTRNGRDFFPIHDPARGRLLGVREGGTAGGARRDETSASARFGRAGEFRVTGARAEAAAGPERLPRRFTRAVRVRRENLRAGWSEGVEGLVLTTVRDESLEDRDEVRDVRRIHVSVFR